MENNFTTTAIVTSRVKNAYIAISNIQKNSIAAVESGENIDHALDKAGREVDDAVASSFGNNADVNYLAYVQGLIIMAERFAGTPYGDIVKAHLIDVVSKVPEIMVQFHHEDTNEDESE